ncbi:glycan biosynthesis hexose transferase WsfD [Paenibacillus koleovorans]|uniref:glycan biosynthesis hexose transferase WsfD n=1 Tax=Paenibacillus koleovorans TaxID=121608 RepID=UPI001581306D|nr:hypothetical protein [Paenibacillus koleovorans]
MRAKRSRFPNPYRYLSLSRFLTPAQLAAIGVLVVSAIALLLRPVVGLADNGDYFRILYSNGLYFNRPDYDSQYLGYFVRQFGILQYFNENGALLASSQSIFIRAAVWLNRLVYDSQVFDIRFQAVLYILLYSAAVFLLVESLTWNIHRKYGYGIAALAVFVFGDTGYTSFFNSFYSESVVLIATMTMFATGLLFYRNRYNDYVLMAIFLGSSLLLTTSKQQNAPVGIAIAIVGLLFIYLRKESVYRVLTAASLGLILFAGVATYVLIPQQFVNINKYHAMTRGVMMEAGNPEKALDQFGIDPQYAILNKSIYYEPFTTVDVNSGLLQRHFYDHYGFGSILLYYALHPDQGIQMLDAAARSAFTIRPIGIGNYEQAVGKPFGAQTNFFTAYSWLKDAAAPKTFGFIVIWAIVVIGVYAPSFVLAVRKRQLRPALRLPLLLMMMVVGLSGIVVSLIGAGDADLAKHEFLFTAAFDLVSFVTVSDLFRRRLWRGETEGGVQRP